MEQKGVYNCIVIDDDKLDRLSLVAFARPYSFLNIIGTFESAEQASSFIDSHQVDVLFSDIDMPGINGIELRREWLNIPVCIFVTSYPDYAAESFEVSAFDFMVKPLTEERFDACMRRCEQYFSILKKAELFDLSIVDDHFFFKDGYKEIKLPLNQIVYLEALKDYTSIVTAEKRYMVLAGISSLLNERPFSSFVRVHRSFAVQRHFVDTVTRQEIIVNNTTIPVGRKYKANLKTLTNRT
jgi:two-component system, LytTR family, response regulator